MNTMRAITATLLSGLMALSAQPPQTQPPQTQPPQTQQETPAPATKGPTKFATTLQLVLVDISVKDKSGQPIKGLKAGDFTVLEDGKKQDVKIFQFQELEETAAPE